MFQQVQPLLSVWRKLVRKESEKRNNQAWNLIIKI